MIRSADRILTTHCGSLPRPKDLLAPLHAKDACDYYDRADLAARARQSVAEVVRKQVDTGIDIVGDGEHSKSSFASYARARIGGLDADRGVAGASCAVRPATRRRSPASIRT